MGCWGPCPLTFLLMPLNGAHMITGVAFSFSHKMLMNRRCLCECLRMQIVNPLKSILNAVVKAHRQKAKLEHICPVVLLKWLPDCEKMFHCCCIYEATVTTIRNWRSKLPASFKHDSLFLLLYVRMYVDYKCDHFLLSSFWSQEAHVTDPDTNKSPGRPNTKTATPVPRTKVHARLYSSMPACVRLYLCVNSPQCTCYGSLDMSLYAVKCSVVFYAWHSQVKLAWALQIPLHSPF